MLRMPPQGTSNFTAAEREKLAKIDVGVKSNLNATSAPTANDDSVNGYSVGSTWIYNNITYLCTNAAQDTAVWVSTADIYYFDTWSLLVTAISEAGTTYVNKHATVANANGGPAGGTTYTAPDALMNIVVDGGSATYKINTQGANYSVTCQARTVTNPVIKSVMLTAAAKPTTAGYYIFTVTPTDGLPSGVSLNDISYYDGSAWSCWQKYTQAVTALVANDETGLIQVTWRKFNGTWMSTADEFIPDGNEYQTGKLYNGKAVYRRCTAGTTGTITSAAINTGMTIPMTGTVLRIEGTIKRSTGTIWLISSQGVAPDTFNFAVLSDGEVVYGLNQSSGGGYTTSYNNTDYTVWVEYTKS